MPQPSIAAYLNDHLAGSVAALGLLERLEKDHAGTPLGTTLTSLRMDIEAARGELQSLMARLGVSASTSRQAAAWLTEKLTAVKLRIDDPSGGPLRLLEAIEAVAIGLDGQRALWLALDAASANNPALRGTDYPDLARRAAELRGRAETIRLDAARAALAAS